MSDEGGGPVQSRLDEIARRAEDEAEVAGAQSRLAELGAPAWRGRGRGASFGVELLVLCARQARPVTCRLHAGYAPVTRRLHAEHMSVTSRLHIGHMSVCARQARLARRHPLLITVNLVCTVAIGVITGILFFQVCNGVNGFGAVCDGACNGV